MSENGLLADLSIALISASVTIGVAWFAIEAQRRRDRENHRREKLEELARISTQVALDLLRKGTAVHWFAQLVDRMIEEGANPERFESTTVREHLPDTGPMRDAIVIGRLWFPELKEETSALSRAAHSFMEGSRELLSRIDRPQDFAGPIGADDVDEVGARLDAVRDAAQALHASLDRVAAGLRNRPRWWHFGTR